MPDNIQKQKTPPIRSTGLVRRVGRLTTLDKCPPGMFEFNGSFGFKTEYSDPHLGPEAYCVESGEVFWGGATNNLQRGSLLVQPVEVIYAKNCKCCKGTGRLVGKGIYVRGVVCDCPKCGGTGKAPNIPS